MIKSRSEMRVYEALGVTWFRKLVFQLEKVIHIKDHGYNRNYHIKVNNISGIREFSKYLLYNGSIHIKNILIALVYGFIRCIIHTPFFWLDTIVLILSIKDLYCIILQRWNYLRINIRLELLERRRSERIDRNAQKIMQRIKESGYSKESAAEDCYLIEKFQHKTSQCETIILNECNYTQIGRIINVISKEK